MLPIYNPRSRPRRAAPLYGIGALEVARCDATSPAQIMMIGVRTVPTNGFIATAKFNLALLRPVNNRGFPILIVK